MVIEGLAPAGSEACSTAWMSLEKPAPAGQRAVAAAPRRRKERTPNHQEPDVKPWRASSRHVFENGLRPHGGPRSRKRRLGPRPVARAVGAPPAPRRASTAAPPWLRAAGR